MHIPSRLCLARTMPGVQRILPPSMLWRTPNGLCPCEGVVISQYDALRLAHRRAGQGGQGAGRLCVRGEHLVQQEMRVHRLKLWGGARQ